jgi:hypothetical protein
MTNEIPRLKVPGIMERLRKNAISAIMSLMLGVGVSAAGSHFIGKYVSKFVVGERVSDQELKRMRAELAKVIKEKEGLGPVGNFLRWWGKVTDNPKEWFERNEGTLRYKISRAEKIKDLQDVFEEMMYYLFSLIIFLYTVNPSVRLTYRITTAAAARRRVDRLSHITNAQTDAIEQLQKQSGEQAKLIADAVVILNEIAEKMNGLKDKSPDDLEEGKENAEGLIDRLKKLNDRIKGGQS